MQSKITKCVTDNFITSMSSMRLPEKFGILLAFSGGADSSALLSLLHQHREKFGYILHALHVNHMIRGDEADRDEAFCKSVCDRLEVEFHLHTADIPTLSKQRKTGLEETARDVRYEVLKTVVADLESVTGLKFFIATAHNADDNIETILFNLTRGASLNGICGIKPQRGNIIRPLLLSSKSEICTYCEENSVKYITDSTNSDTVYTRNKLRSMVLPILREINPAVATSVSRMSSSLFEDNDYMTSVTMKFIGENVKDNKLALSVFNELHPAVKSRVLNSLMKSAGAKEIYEVHINALLKLCESAVAHSMLNLPGDVTATIESGMLIFQKSDYDDTVPQVDIALDYGEHKIPHTGDIVARFDSQDKDNIEKFKIIYKKFIQTDITSATIKGALSVRFRKSEDRYSINGVNRKLKKLLWEIESDVRRRNTLPLICDDEGILWVPGARSRTGTFPKADDKYETFFYVDYRDIK